VLPSLPLCRQAVTRTYLLAWHRSLESRALASATIRRKLAALSSLFEYLCETNAMISNLVKGVRRPKMASSKGQDAGDWRPSGTRPVGNARRHYAAGQA